MPELTPEIREAAARAADWLEANPDKQVRFKMAQNKYGDTVSTIDPEASCFCAVGRLAHELELDVFDDYSPLTDLLGEDQTRKIYRANDLEPSRGILKLRELSA